MITAFDPQQSYRLMVRMRMVDQALVDAWHAGLVPGEYHSGIGEEGIFAGLIPHLRDGDSMALEHRGTGPLVGRGADVRRLVLECLGSTDGLSSGMAGHMHLMDPSIPASCDGIVGSGAPLAMGQAIAHAQLGNGRVAIGVHGEGAMNQGMVMEAYNLAVAWRLPVIFVVKDNQWSITTHNKDVTGGSLAARARSFGLTVRQVNGRHVDKVHHAVGSLVERARAGDGPGLLLARCHRPGGHFEGDPLVKLMHHPVSQSAVMVPGLVRSAVAPEGGRVAQRARGAGELGVRLAQAALTHSGRASGGHRDPLRAARKLLSEADAARIAREVADELNPILTEALSSIDARPVFGHRKATGGSR